jgi:hypothetical protein
LFAASFFPPESIFLLRGSLSSILYEDTQTGVGVIFLRGGGGAKDGQKLVGAEQRSKKKVGKQEAGVEDGRSWTEQEHPAAGAG